MKYLLLSIFVICGIKASLSAADLSDLSYEILGDSVTIADCDYLAWGELVIPETIESKPVTSIGDEAFYNCPILTSVAIPYGVTSISPSAFYYCSSLTSVAISASVTNVGNYAFSGCSRLKNVIFAGDAEINLGTEAFSEAAPAFKVYFYESATGFATPTWEGYASEELSLSDDNDGDRFPNKLERLLGTSPLDGSSRFQVGLSNGNAGVQIHYTPHSDLCQFIVESTTDLSDPDRWQIDESLTFSSNTNVPTADLPMNGPRAVFYRIQVSVNE